MNHSVRRQLILSVALVHAALMTIFVFDLVERQREFLHNEAIARAESLAEGLAVLSVSGTLTQDLGGLEEITRALNKTPGLEYTMILDSTGRVLSHSQEEKVGLYVSDSLSLSLLKRQSRKQRLLIDQKQIDVAAPIISGSHMLGWARVAMDQSTESASLDLVTKKGLLYTMLAILVGTAMAYLIARRLSRGLDGLMRTVNAVREGDYSVRADENPVDEVGRLGAGFNTMLQAVRDGKEKFRTVADFTYEWEYWRGPDGQMVWVSPSCLRVTGYSVEEFIADRMLICNIPHPDDKTWFNKHIDKVDLQSEEPCDMDIRIVKKSGEVIWINHKCKAIYHKGGTYLGTRACNTDITQRKQLEEQLTFRALHDPLTGLANRTLCLDRIAQANERAARKPGKTFAVVFIDLDRFKVINDSLGHEAGDLALREIANRLLACARKVDTVCRYGGDEFILVLEDLNKRETIRILKRVRETLKTPLTIGAHVIQVGASYGIAHAPQKNCQSEDLLRNANIALHYAKISRRNRIVAYRKDMHEAAIHTMSLQSDMRRGLDAHEFFMVYQPIFNLGNNHLAGFEALIRWNHPQRGVVLPGEFIPMAEESGFIFELGNFALNQACLDMVGLLRNLPAKDRLTVSVNLSPIQLSRQGMADIIEQALIASGLPPAALVLEITESSIMNYPEASAHLLAKLKGKGVDIAIDDFGTGYSSMSVLHKLSVNRLKVDMSFVKRITASIEDREIVRAIITLAHSLRLKTVAEGIETREQLEILKQLGCELGQGYLYSRPLLLADVHQAIRQKVCTAIL